MVDLVVDYGGFSYSKRLSDIRTELQTGRGVVMSPGIGAGRFWKSTPGKPGGMIRKGCFFDISEGDGGSASGVFRFSKGHLRFQVARGIGVIL